VGVRLTDALGPLLRLFWRWYVERIVCLHFCKFKESGSDLIYTHVHILPENPGKATGLGHDDHTNTTDKGHATVSDGDGVRIGPEDERSMGLRDLHYMATAYFHAATGDGECPDEFLRVKCKCGGQDVWVCYTMDHDVFQGWYDARQWTNHQGKYAYPNTPAALVDEHRPGVIDCGSSVVISQFELDKETSCNGFGGPGDGENPLIVEARSKLQLAMDKIACGSGCTKSTTETFRGWKCGPDQPGGFLLAEAVVQWTIECKSP
jgi:hypothetical protein